MTPAEKRVKELIDRWLTSLDLHLQYVDLKDSAYNNVQPWPVHDRPTRWVLEHARQKVLELQAAFEARLAMGDSKFAESVENIVFLANLVGLQHVQRFIPIADPERHGAGTLTELDGLKAVKPLSTPPAATTSPPQPAPQASTPKPTAASVAPAPRALEARTGDTTVAMPPRVATSNTPVAAASPRPTLPPAPAPPAPAAKQSDLDATREMPRPMRPNPSTVSTASSVPVLTHVEAKTAKPASPPAPPAKPIPSEPISEIHNLVIGDAVRLLNWGKSWHELADLIARIADRPKLPEIRKILRTHRPTIEMRAAEEVEQDPKPKDGKKEKGKAKQR